MTTQDTPVTTTAEQVHEQVRKRYAQAAEAANGCCGPSECCSTTELLTIEKGFGRDVYGGDAQGQVPDLALEASLGCGNPMAVAALNPGETVLDLGSGGGIDVILSARRVGETGRAIGLDMTEEMLDLARRNAADAGVSNVEFLKGQIEDVPLEDDSVDVIISNCVVNLSPDKPAVLAEMARVLRPGGRIGIADVVTDDSLSPAERAERGDWVGCIAGAMSVSEVRDGLSAAGFVDIDIDVTHSVADGVHSALIRANRPR